MTNEECPSEIVDETSAHWRALPGVEEPESEDDVLAVFCGSTNLVCLSASLDCVAPRSRRAIVVVVEDMIMTLGETEQVQIHVRSGSRQSSTELENLHSISGFEMNAKNPHAFLEDESVPITG